MKKAFTLIELVIVVVIIGILAALAIPIYVDIKTQAAVSQEDYIIGSLKSAIIADWLKQKSEGIDYTYPENPFNLISQAPPTEVIYSSPENFDGVTWKIGIDEHESTIYSPRGRKWRYAETWSSDMMLGFPPSIVEYQ